MSARERLLDHVRAVGTEQLLAVGWATVDLDRASREVGGSLGLPGSRFADVQDSIILGARCRLAVAALDGAVSVALLEPFTEGRLAASLARHDEGPVAVWRSPADGGSPGVTLSAEEPGPLGPERLEVGGRSHGPYRLVVGAPGTIPT